MKLSRNQLKLARLLLLTPALCFAVLSLVSLFVPYQANPRYFPLPIHISLFALSHCVIGFLLFDLVKNSKWNPVLLLALSAVTSLAWGIGLARDLLSKTNLFSEGSTYFPNQADLIKDIVNWSIALTVFNLFVRLKSGSSPQSSNVR